MVREATTLIMTRTESVDFSARDENPTERALSLLAASAYKKDNAELAATLLEHALLLNSNDQDNILCLAKACRRQGRFTEAIQAYRRYLLCRPQDRVAAIGLGVCLFNQGEVSDAIRIMSLAIKQDMHPQISQ